mmetsp:Transcript_28792/g.83529  ORF Transcript_28792/g.83529 Transcript_28792/m.83529 type:complete len:131 (-) Transcript_28792:1034-1426(-)
MDIKWLDMKWQSLWVNRNAKHFFALDATADTLQLVSLLMQLSNQTVKFGQKKQKEKFVIKSGRGALCRVVNIAYYNIFTINLLLSFRRSEMLPFVVRSCQIRDPTSTVLPRRLRTIPLPSSQADMAGTDA